MRQGKLKNKKIQIFLISFFLFIIFILVSIYSGNNNIQVSHFYFKNNKLKNQLKVVHLSDLHEKIFGQDNKVLINKVKKESPDLIFITGDIVSFCDETLKTLNKKSEKFYQENLNYVVKILTGVKSIAPTYIVLGNHEHALEKFDQGFDSFRNIVANAGVVLLINEISEIKLKGSDINIFGVDNSYYQDIKVNDLIEQFQKRKGLKIILDHYPTDFKLNGKFSYVNYDIDYVFSGHEHGGQIRIPFIGGVFSHEEGLFPKYSEGVHFENNSALIISRGLGNSTFPVRIFNRPEIVVVTIN